jgi:uncharacterized membrane protein (UPF0127 family)
LNDYDPLNDKDKNIVVILTDPQENWNIQSYLGSKNLSNLRELSVIETKTGKFMNVFLKPGETLLIFEDCNSLNV